MGRGNRNTCIAQMAGYLVRKLLLTGNRQLRAPKYDMQDPLHSDRVDDIGRSISNYG
jgi:hypothetical protein